nr:immunoglobulin heavy chain junction region [Macaca mulatta]MOX00522.1 immunoglobulin heavy chain junction region [Macaca mulatta]MOX02147.1 immunoglobulin heavy chain junction region [Macaca mulatta]MOX02306.1 immunoglobulin heavy chain junction region [Macaca mulatta]MOX03051.1 immunoglobulin heavy chain junction region [Macaca mulatta]
CVRSTCSGSGCYVMGEYFDLW